MSLPKEMNLSSNKPLSVDCKPSINRYRSDNTEYKNNDVISIEIPTGRAQYLFPKSSFIEGSIKCNITNAGTGASNVYFDQSCYSLFNRMTIRHGGVVVEDLVHCNKIWTSLMDIQINESERKGMTITHLIGDQSSTSNDVYNNGLSGYKISVLASQSAVDSEILNFSFVLPSSLLGSLSSKCLPLGQLGTSSIYIELELASPHMVFVGQSSSVALTDAAFLPTVNSYTVSNIFYNAKICNMPNDVNAAILESTNGIINLPSIAYHVETKTISSGSSLWNDKFSHQYSSMKGFWFFLMNSSVSSGNILKSRSITARSKANLQEFYLDINGEAYPSAPIAGTARFYSELLRSFDALNDTNGGGILNFNNYAKSDVDLHTQDSGVLLGLYGEDANIQRFIAGVDLDKMNHSSDTLMSGTSTTGQLLSLNLKFSSPTTDNLQLYSFVMHDVLYTIEQGQLSYKK